MSKFKRPILVSIGLLLFFVVVGFDGCDTTSTPSSDSKQKQQQEQMLQEATSQVGMPAIKNFRERKLAKDILELRDQEGLVTYTYTFSEQTGQYRFFCESIGYGLPYATQFTNPQKIEAATHQTGYVILPQADPNGLFSPSSADATWVMCKDPNGTEVRPIYVEPKIIVSTFKLNTQ